MYKLCVCNLGYDDVFLCKLDGTKSKDIEDLILEIEYDYSDVDEIDGLKITYKNFNPSDKDFNEDEIIDIIRTEDKDCCIYIRRLDDNE